MKHTPHVISIIRIILFEDKGDFDRYAISDPGDEVDPSKVKKNLLKILSYINLIYKNEILFFSYSSFSMLV